MVRGTSPAERIPPQMAAFFAGMAVKLYCPAMMKSVTDGTFFDWIQAPHM